MTAVRGTNSAAMYSRILSLFPKDYFRFCFGYGSGVFKQLGAATKTQPMVDMVFVVDDPEGFHGQNILMNPKHYSSLRYLGYKSVAAVQRWPAGLYYNTLVPIKEENIILKYGVISSQDLINDLLDWNHLYIAGRLQKPVKFIVEPTSVELATALRRNLMSALHTAFIILPQYFTERHLYKTIANLSYGGDFRMTIGEDKNKVKNIVDSQIHNFRKLYRPYIKHLEDHVEIPHEDNIDQTCMQDMSIPTRLFHLYQLPKVAQQVLLVEWRSLVRRRKQDTEEVLRCLANDTEDCSDLMASALRSIVFKSSSQQSLKGILTAGVIKSIKYSGSKLKKMWASQQPHQLHSSS